MDAVLWNFIVMGEICNRLGGRFHADYPDIPWMGVIGLRNVIAHGYDIVDWNIIGPVIKNDLPLLIKHAQRILDSYGPPPEM